MKRGFQIKISSLAGFIILGSSKGGFSTAPHDGDLRRGYIKLTLSFTAFLYITPLKTNCSSQIFL